MIRQQQLELQRLQASHPHHSHGAEDSSAIMERSNPSTPQVASFQGSGPGHSSTSSISRSGNQPHPRSSFDMARTDIQRRSRTPSRGASPRMRSGSISAESGDWVLAGRDESAFYQAETQMLVRENQMLRHRVRDLGKLTKDFSWGEWHFLTIEQKSNYQKRQLRQPACLTLLCRRSSNSLRPQKR